MDGLDDRSPFEENPDLQDKLKGQFGEIGEGGFDGASTDPFGFTDEPSWAGVTVGDFFYIHGQVKLSEVFRKFLEKRLKTN